MIDSNYGSGEEMETALDRLRPEDRRRIAWLSRHDQKRRDDKLNRDSTSQTRLSVCRNPQGIVEKGLNLLPGHILHAERM